MEFIKALSLQNPKVLFSTFPLSQIPHFKFIKSFYGPYYNLLSNNISNIEKYVMVTFLSLDLPLIFLLGPYQNQEKSLLQKVQEA